MTGTRLPGPRARSPRSIDMGADYCARAGICKDAFVGSAGDEPSPAPRRLIDSSGDIEMRTRLALALFVTVTGLGVRFVLPQNDEIVWFEDYGEALRQARETHKPLLVEFRCEP